MTDIVIGSFCDKTQTGKSMKQVFRPKSVLPVELQILVYGKIAN